YINILIRNQNDWGASYSFSSQNLKKSIYDSIPGADCISYHEKAVHILRDRFNRENRGKEDELINQMLRAGMDSEVKEYITETAEEMVVNKSINAAIQFLEHAYGLISRDGHTEERIMISSKLGELNCYIGEYSKAILQYDVVEKLAAADGDTKLLIDVYIRKYSLLYKSGDGKASLNYLSAAKKLLGTVDYRKGIYELIITINRMMLHKRKFGTYIKILENALSTIDREKYRFHYARMLGISGRFLAYKGRPSEGLERLLESVRILEDMEIYRKQLYPLNAIGSVYYNHYNDKQKAREYYERCLSISQKISDPYYLGISYNNIAEIYRMEDKHSEALQFYQNSLKNSIIIRDKYVEYIAYLNISMTNMEIEDYNKALLIYNDMEREFISSKYSGDLMDLFNQCKAEFCYAMGEYEEASEYARKSVDMCKSWGISVNYEAHFVGLMSGIQQSGTLDFKRDNEFLDTVFGDNLYKLGRTACVKLAELYA
ncbi:MAG TPA: tetratricopeptide repeat protein, partial [Clostridia bacterium]|nr:tetratricopeptide repeat protein [Clostridia bacterium]